MRWLFVVGLVGLLALILWCGAQDDDSEFGYWRRGRRPVKVSQTFGSGVTVTVTVTGDGVKRKWLGDDFGPERRFRRRQEERRDDRMSRKMRKLDEQMRLMSLLFEEDEDHYGGYWDWWGGW